ncbi:hypothetical protein AMAG_07217 [Allomyces macrogynus ATCC 38327]|uniref:AB hydrolase-1 domain-containing protein n=1 Tax=Allomyces macrogynus (strain ATCC 38327) TaxID=578462 RepID=A0A0L0SHU7_ALLM3|nr:hypothetical protein AMAG_07217 [Allomyces macrogynus ATCC 38327]|eukprot:KNE61950.1 hypothetical protein AMAG_07217 [Allomyces macrogynus ATCC 38327]
MMSLHSALLSSSRSVNTLRFMSRTMAMAATTGKHGVADVLILGWAQSDLRHVAKYQNVYHGRLLADASETAPIMKWTTSAFASQTLQFAKPERWSFRDIEPIYQVLRDQGHLRPAETASDQTPSAPRAPLVLHLLSNGGVNSLVILLHLARERNMQLTDVAAIVLDSAPTPVHAMGIWPWSGLFVDAILPASMPTAFRNTAQTLLYAQMRAKSVIMTGLLGRPARADTNFATLVNHPDIRAAPRLLLYSRVDDMVPLADIELALAKMREAGHAAVVESVDFVDSAHVSHLRAYPEKYTKEVGQFLARVGLAEMAVQAANEPVVLKSQL